MVFVGFLVYFEYYDWKVVDFVCVYCGEFEVMFFGFFLVSFFVVGESVEDCEVVDILF